MGHERSTEGHTRAPAQGESRETAASVPPAVRIAPVTADLRAAVAALRVAPGQEDYLAANRDSLDEADVDPDARPRAILADGVLVGFLMYEAPKDDGDARIYRFMIDRAAQGRGHGSAALRAVLREIAAEPHVREVSICYMPQNEGARRLYGAAGFVEEGLDEDGEMIARLVLPAGARP